MWYLIGSAVLCFVVFVFRVLNSPKKPKYRLVPDTYGRYDLEMWHEDICMYLHMDNDIEDTDHAERVIQNLSKKTLYFSAYEEDK